MFTDNNMFEEILGNRDKNRFPLTYYIQKEYKTTNPIFETISFKIYGLKSILSYVLLKNKLKT